MMFASSFDAAATDILSLFLSSYNLNIPDSTSHVSASKKGKVLLYLSPSVGPRTDPGVQAVSPQVSFLVIPQQKAAITFHQNFENLRTFAEVMKE